MRMRLLCIWLLLIPCVAVQAADEKILAELHEQVVQVPVRVESLFGAKEVNLTATIYRPDGDGPFPLIVLSHGTSPNAPERSKIGRFRRIPQTRGIRFLSRRFRCRGRQMRNPETTVMEGNDGRA